MCSWRRPSSPPRFLLLQLTNSINSSVETETGNSLFICWHQCDSNGPHWGNQRCCRRGGDALSLHPYIYAFGALIWRWKVCAAWCQAQGQEMYLQWVFGADGQDLVLEVAELTAPWAPLADPADEAGLMGAAHGAVTPAGAQQLPLKGHIG